jgi:hypothetical protein
MSDIAETVSETMEKVERGSGDKAHPWLESVAAALVALLATFMALCNIKDGNIVQAMAQAQTRSVDTWSFYQAKSTKQHLAEGMKDQLVLQRAMGIVPTAEARALLDREILAYEEKAKRYEKEKEEIRGQAEAFEKEYDRLNMHDDQFDMAEAGLSLGVALLGITLLTRRRWLFVLAVVFAAFGTVLGLAGFLGWAIHPDAIAKFLS